MDSLENYHRRGVPTGGFLTALLENQPVFDVVERADEDNVRALKELCMYVFNAMPIESWGSPERVSAWTRRGGLEGR